MTTIAHPSLVFAAELEFACLYAMTNPSLAMECARHAFDAAAQMGRPDLMWRANELMGAL